MLNASRLAGSLAVSGKTVTRYLDLLVDTLMVRRVSAHAADDGKRLVKAPKVYVRDSGLLHALLGVADTNEVLSHPVAGDSWEGFAIESILAAAPQRAAASFCRTADGAEIDLILELPGGESWAVELKRGRSQKPTNGFHVACRDIGPTRPFVVYPGTDRYPLPGGAEAIGLEDICREASLWK